MIRIPPHIPPLTAIQKEQLQRYFSIYAVITVITSFICYFFLPEVWGWVSYVPVMLLVIAVIVMWLAIALHGVVLSGPEFVCVGRVRVTCCRFCPMVEIKDNVVNSKFPVVKCRETTKVCYTPMKISGWCPYAKK